MKEPVRKEGDSVQINPVQMNTVRGWGTAGGSLLIRATLQTQKCPNLSSQLACGALGPGADVKG